MMKLREQLMTMRRWETATMMFILGVQIIELVKSDKRLYDVKFTIGLTKYLNGQLDDVDDTLEAVANNENNNDASEDCPNHKVSPLPLTHHTEPGTSSSNRENMFAMKSF